MRRLREIRRFIVGCCAGHDVWCAGHNVWCGSSRGGDGRRAPNARARSGESHDRSTGPGTGIRPRSPGCPTHLPRILALFVGLSPLVLSSVLAQDRVQFPDSESRSVDAELRIVWGGPTPEPWDVSVDLGQGSLELVRNLSMDSASIGAALPESTQRVRVPGLQPTTFAGIDVRTRAPIDSRLTLTITNPARNTTSEHTIVLEEALGIAGSWVRAVDETGNRIAVQRLDSDRLRVSGDRSPAILTAGSRWQLTVTANRTGLPAGNYRLRAIVRDGQGREVSLQQQEALIDQTGSFPVRSLHVDIPATEGPYRLELSLVADRSFPAFLGRPPELTRSIDFVALDPQRPLPKIASWQRRTTLNAADYAHRSAWSRWIPNGFGSTAGTWGSLRSSRFAWPPARPVRAGTAVSRKLTSRHPGTSPAEEVLQLAPGSWIAIPLTDLAPGLPHRLRLTVPIDDPMQLGVALRLEDGKLLRSLGNDFQLTIAPHQCRPGEVADYDLLFWPTAGTSFLALCNLHATRNASVARIGVDAATLEPHRPGGGSNAGGSPPASRGDTSRRVALYLDKPLLSEFFAPPKDEDPGSGRRLASWKTWYTGLERLVQFMHWYGYNAVVINALSDGGGLMPNQHLQPTPRYDDGVFFSDGRSPDIKDAVQLILQIAEREGFDVVIGMELNTRLPQLESLYGMREDLWQRPLNGADAPNLQIYNPLNRQVQNEIEAIMRDLMQRYGSYRAFAGVQLNLGYDSHLLFHGDRFGFNEQLVQEYEQAVGANLPQGAKIEEVMKGPIRLAFLQWRAEQLTDFLIRIADLIRAGNQARRLYLNTSPLWADPPDPRAFYNPDLLLRSPRELLVTVGLSPEKIDLADPIVLLTTQHHRAEPLRRVPEWLREVAQEHATARADPAMQLTIFRHRAHTLSADEDPPWADRLNLRMLYPFDVGGVGGMTQILCRQLHARDARWMAVGGWAPLNLNDSQLRNLITALTRIPAVPMADASPRGGKGAVVIRSAGTADAAWVLVLNAGDWEESVEIRYAATRRDIHAHLLAAAPQMAERAEPAPVSIPPDRWILSAAPHSCAVYQIDDPEWRILRTSTECPPAAIAVVGDQLSDLEDRIDRASDPTQQRPLPGLRGEFEQWTPAGDPAGWTRSSLPGVLIEADDHFPHGGRRCVRMIANSDVAGAAWLQSVPVPPPESGRATFRAWLRCSEQQPTVRLVVSGRTRQGHRIERQLTVGRGTPHAIPTDWGTRPFTLVADNLPSEQMDAITFSIELVGSGEIWIDDAAAVQSWMTPDERIYLLGELLVAREQLNSGNPFPASSLVQGFWGQYLDRFALHDSSSEPEGKAHASDASAASRTASPPPPASFLQQIRESMRRKWRN